MTIVLIMMLGCFKKSLYIQLTKYFFCGVLFSITGYWIFQGHVKTKQKEVRKHIKYTIEKTVYIKCMSSKCKNSMF